MTTALLAHTVAGSSTNSTVTTGSIDTTGANLIVIVASWYTSTITISDSKGNTWTGLTAVSLLSALNQQIFYCLNPTVGTGHTFTNGGSALAASIGVLAFHLDSLSGFDVQNSNSSSSAGTTISTGSITPTVNGSVIVAASMSDQQSTTFSVDSGFTKDDDTATVNAQHYGCSTSHLIQATAGAINPTFTYTGSGDMVATIASFKPSAGTPRRALYLA